jgi:CheY-like chemotaxis protein
MLNIAEKSDQSRTQFLHRLKPILVVEDDFNDLALALRELRKLKIRNSIDSVATVEEFIEYMMRTGEYQGFDGLPTPAVIVLDMHLRHADPLEALSWLRSKLKFRKIPTIAISGSGQSPILQRAVDLGAVSWMAKPFIGSDFKRLIERLRLPVDFTGNADTNFNPASMQLHAA